MLFPAVQIVYWVSLSTWFGGVLFIAVAAPVIFRTVRQNNPILPTVLSVNLENQHGTLLAGTIVANLLQILTRTEAFCTGGVFLGLVGQWLMVDLRSYSQLTMLILRSALFIGAAVLVWYNWKAVMPRVVYYRKEYIDHADEPDVANLARELFDRYHKESVLLLGVVLCLLLGMILFSGNISTAHAIF
jgi:hypothetical protein